VSTVSEQIESVDDTICLNIKSLAGQRGLLSQNVLSQLRNLVEGVAVLVHTGSRDAEFSYDAIKAGLAFIKGKAAFNFLGKFHNLVQKSASHYTLDGDSSERLMLKYYEYLYRTRSLLQDKFALSVLENLEDFPVDLDPSLREYHEKIAAKIEAARAYPRARDTFARYYIHKARPFFVNRRVYYEVTFQRAVNRVSKYDRVIAFASFEVGDKYAANLTICQDSIHVLGQTMPIAIIRDWEVSIRPCEFNNFARLLGINVEVRTSSSEYRHLMSCLTNSWESLLDLMDMSEPGYAAVRAAATASADRPLVFPILDRARRLMGVNTPGRNVLRYLMLRMRNQVVKSQYDAAVCDRLSGMNLPYACIPFDSMPFCTSLRAHNPSYFDLVESIDLEGRNHELLARSVKNNVERNGILYTPVGDIAKFGVVADLVDTYNNELYYKHTQRRILLDKGHVFISGYENDTCTILEKLQEYASSRIDGHTQAVERWLSRTAHGIDDPDKKEALKHLFSQSRVALFYGAAGTGKSTMVDHIAHYFNDKSKLFLAHTNPAVDNLKRKVTAQDSEFRTISSHVSRRPSLHEYDLLVIDECSTVSNADLISVLDRTSFKLLVLVGDVYQIASIQFGNWFGMIRSFIPKTSVFELKTPFRTKNHSLLHFWDKVRSMEDDVAEVIAHNGYSTILDETLFDSKGNDEIILCLNYDGLYGINNINRFLQSGNTGAATTWRDVTYKIGDPILFNETERFRPVIYNNLKGRIVNIASLSDQIQFDVDLDRPLSEFDVVGDDLEWMGESTVRFSVYLSENSDDDDDSVNTSVPFQVAYAVSIHKAQGLEYDSVKIVITDANEDDITHSIFYTAVTRARKHLQIFWTPETQNAVLQRLKRKAQTKDVALLTSRRGLVPVA
jgi:hypothetical protein